MDIDLNRITLREFRRLVDADTPQEEQDVILARACGCEPSDLESLPYPEYRRLVRAFFDKAREPLADPN